MKKHTYEPPQFLDEELLMLSAEMGESKQKDVVDEDPETPKTGDEEDLP